MSQISNIPVRKDIKEKIDNILTEAISSCSSKKITDEFLDGLLTPTERVMLSKRLAIAYLLEKGHSYETIKSILKVSTTTIGSVSIILKLKGRGLREILKILYRKRQLKEVFRSLTDAAIELIGKGKGGDWKSTGRYLHQREMEKQSPL